MFIDKNLPNKIINGNFDIWQRGTSFAAIADGAFSADRWKYEKTGAMVHTVARNTDVPSNNLSNYSLRHTITTADAAIAAGDYCFANTRVEGFFARSLRNNDGYLSFWAYATKTGIHCVTFRNTGADRTCVVEYTINASNTWEYKTVKVPKLPSSGTWDFTNGIGLRVMFPMACGSTFHAPSNNAWITGNYFGSPNIVNDCDTIGNIFAISQVMLHDGNEAIPFETAGRDVAEEERLCQRYYEQYNTPSYLWVLKANTSTSAQGSMIFKTHKRANPVVAYSFGVNDIFQCTSGNKVITALSIDIVSIDSTRASFTSSGLTTNEMGYIALQAANSYIAFNSEL